MRTDEMGKPPQPIQPDEVLANNEEVQDIGAEVAGAIEPPTYNAAPIRKSFSAPGDASAADGRVLQATFSPNTTVPEHLRNTMEQLGTIQRWLHGRDVQRVQRNHVIKLTRELFDYMYKDMQHMLMLSMDVQKKQRFIQYLQANRSLQNQIQHQSGEAQLAIISTMFDNRYDAYRNKNDRDIELRRMRDAGTIDDKQYRKSVADNERMIDDHIARVDQTAEVMIQRHGEFLFKTLELFQTKLIDGGHL